MQFQKVLALVWIRENDLLWITRKRSRNCQKQMSNMPSVFDFGFQTSHYSIPNDSLNGFGDYDQPNGGQNVSTNRNVYPNRSFDEKEINLTVNMTNVLDGKELANGTYEYTTALQERKRKQLEQF